MALSKVRIQLLNEETGEVMEEVDVLTSPDSVLFPSGQTLTEVLAGIETTPGEKGDTGTSFRMKGAWTANTSYVNNAQYIDVVTKDGSSYACKTSHTSASAWNESNWTLIAQKGEKGATGAAGQDGADGKDGAAGAKGATGTSIRMKGAWAASTPYVNDSQYIDVVTRDGSSYACKSSHTSTSSWDSTKWTLIAQKGATGAAGADGQDGAAGAKGATGTSIRMKGAWAASTPYVNDSQYIDIVTKDGSSYACKSSHTSSTSWDESKWTLIAQKGEKGATGAAGQDGADGKDGAAGAKGATGTSIRMKGAWAASTAYVNDSQYVDVVTKDGSSYACKTSHTSSSAWDSSKWTLIAQKGATGAAGAPGKDGADGDSVKFGTTYEGAKDVKIFFKKL